MWAPERRWGWRRGPRATAPSGLWVRATLVPCLLHADARGLSICPPAVFTPLLHNIGIAGPIAAQPMGSLQRRNQWGRYRRRRRPCDRSTPWGRRSPLDRRTLSAVAHGVAAVHEVGPTAADGIAVIGGIPAPHRGAAAHGIAATAGTPAAHKVAAGHGSPPPMRSPTPFGSLQPMGWSLPMGSRKSSRSLPPTRSPQPMGRRRP